MKRATKSIIFTLIILSAIVGVCTYAVIQNALAPLAQREDQSEFAAKENVVIKASTFNGNIIIQPTTGNQIVVNYQVSAPNGFLNDIKTSVNETKDDNLTTIITSAAIQVNNGVAYKANLVINVPTTSTYNLTLTTHNGNVDVQVQKSGEIGVITDNGNIKVNVPRETLFQVVASVANGKISHQGINMDASPDLATRLKGATVGGQGSLVMTLMSGNGDITISYQ